MSPHRTRPWLVNALLGASLVAVAMCLWLPGKATPGAASGARGTSAGAPPTRAPSAAAAAPAPAERTALSEQVAPRRPREPLIFAGHVVQRGGGPLPPTSIFVDAPDRSLLSSEQRRRAAQTCDVSPDGGFRFALPGDLYEDTAFINIVGGHGDMTLLTGLAKIEADATITVSGPDAPESLPLTGTLAVAGAPVRNGDLLLLHRDTGDPISFQWGCQGNPIAVSLRPLKERFADVVGPVVLRLDGDDGLHAAADFASFEQLRERLAAGLELRPKRVTVALPELGPGVAVAEASLWSSDNSRFPRREALSGGTLELRLTPGDYRVRGADPAQGVYALAGFSFDGDRTPDVSWAYVAPGPHSCLLLLEDGGGAPVAGAKIEARLARPDEFGVRPDWFRVAAESDSGGRAYLSGLLAGSYRLRIAHRELAAQEVDLEVPEHQTVRVTLRATVSVAWQLRLPSATVAAGRARVFVRELDRPGAWVAHDLGPGSASGDYVLQALPGSYEVVCSSGPYLGRRTLRLDAARSAVARVDLQPAPILTGVVVRADGTPATSVWVELVSTETGVVHARGAADASGAFALTSLAAALGDETLLVKDAAATVLAREAARDGMEIRIDR